jgi:hydroxyacylglutathione hydrolase
MEIIFGVHRITGVRGANCYLVIQNSDMTVIDTGMPGNGKRIINYVKALGKNPSDVRYVILTHGDVDHIGSVSELKSLTGAKIAIHTADAPILAGKTGYRNIRGPLGLLFKMITPLIILPAVEPDVIFEGNSEFKGFKIIQTPGHTDGSICLYLPPKVIFIGDAMRCYAGGKLKPPARNLAADIAKAEASIYTISTMEFDYLLPGHGPPVIGSASARVKELLKHMT